MGKLIQMPSSAAESPAKARMAKQLDKARSYIDQNMDAITGVVITVIRDDGTSYTEIADIGLSPLTVIGALHRAIMDQY